MSINHVIESLINLSEKKLTALEELLKVTMLQNNLINTDQLDSLLIVIEERQSVISRIDEIDVAFLHKYAVLKKELGTTSLQEVNLTEYPSLRVLRTHTDTIMGLLKDIDNLDKLNHESLKEDFETVKEELKKVKLEKQRSKITYAYKSKYAGVQGVFVDNQDK